MSFITTQLVPKIMAELLIRTIDKTADNVDQDRLLSKRGDVIVVEPDGHNWGAQELTSDFWMIIKVPGVEVEMFNDLLIPQISITGIQVRRRSRGINLDDPILSSIIGNNKIVELASQDQINALYNARFDKPVITLPLTLN